MATGTLRDIRRQGMGKRRPEGEERGRKGIGNRQRRQNDVFPNKKMPWLIDISIR